MRVSHDKDNNPHDRLRYSPVHHSLGDAEAAEGSVYQDTGMEEKYKLLVVVVLPSLVYAFGVFIEVVTSKLKGWYNSDCTYTG